MPLGNNIVRGALATEFLANLGTGLPMLLYPQQTLATITKPGSITSPIAVDLCQCLGAIFTAIGVPLLYSYPNSARGVATRRTTTYWTYAALEAGFLPILLWKLYSDDSALTEGVLRQGITGVGVAMTFRLWCLLARPTWLAGVSSKKTV